MIENMDEIIRGYFRKILPRPALFFDVNVCDHCNLNCKGCGSFAPLAKESFLKLEDYIRDAERLAEISGGVVYRINILGGEPLLHPELIEFLKITRKLFPIGNINLITNGTLLLKMKDEFWETIRKYDIVLRPTKYPVAVDYDAIKKKAVENEIKFKYFGNAGLENSWIHTVIEELGISNECDSFLLCANANSCSVLRDGKIYPCPRAAKIEIFNKYFNTNFKITNNDYIDIYEDICLEDIMKFLARPIPFCRYCRCFEYRPTSWEQSMRQIGEWT